MGKAQGRILTRKLVHVMRGRMMRIYFSRVSSNFRIVIPNAVRERLSLKSGDFVQYITKGRKMEIKCIDAEGDPFSTFVEWASDADEASYASL